ncbi:hypothetical protein D3C87_1597060 [compost metagenome]
MARVLCETTSEQLFKNIADAENTLTWIREKLHKGTDPSPHPNKIVEVEGGFRYITYSALDTEIPVEAYEALKAAHRLPACFDNQRIIIVEEAAPKQ